MFGPKFGPKSDLKLGFFCHFPNFGLLVFLEIAYNDSLQQFLRSSRVKTPEKKFGEQIWAKIGPEIRFLLFSQVWFISFP